MKLLVRTTLLLLLLIPLTGCGADKPKPAELPKQLMDPPKNRPIPGGTNKPAATTQLFRPQLAGNYLAG